MNAGAGSLGPAGDLVLSFDIPVSLGGFNFDPADLVRFHRTSAGCGGWTLAAANPAFDASAAGIGIPSSSNLIGADSLGTTILLSFDVPTNLGPRGNTIYLPGQIVSWDGASFALFESLSGWPTSSRWADSRRQSRHRAAHPRAAKSPRARRPVSGAKDRYSLPSLSLCGGGRARRRGPIPVKRIHGPLVVFEVVLDSEGGRS